MHGHFGTITQDVRTLPPLTPIFYKKYTHSKQFKKIIFQTFQVEDFWSVYNYIMQPSKLPNGSNYRLFKDGVEPKWEDPSNKQGGSWTVNLPKKMHEQLDDMWLNLILACIGDTLGNGEMVCGIIVSIRKKEDRLAIWTESAKDKDEIMNIGHDFKSSCELDGVKLEFKTHSDMMKVLETNGRPKAKYLI
jgi:translation initiation factor 4E